VKRVWAILRFFTQFGFIVFTYLFAYSQLLSFVKQHNNTIFYNLYLVCFSAMLSKDVGNG